jgi:voltage-gated potassium channel
MDQRYRPRLHNLLGSIALTSALVLLISFAVADIVTPLFFAVIAMTIGGAAFFFFLFPGSVIFSIAFANSLAVYACVFVFFRESNFRPVHGLVEAVGFIMPIFAFLAGAWWRRDAIRAIVTSEHLREARNFAAVLVWLLPVGTIGALTFMIPGAGLADDTRNLVFLGAMGIIAVNVLVVSRDVCTFLLDIGLLFEDFSHRMKAVIAPAFAFFSFYSILVIVFATIYRNLDRLSAEPLFSIGGTVRHIGFAESLYFSVITLSTVGYGDIVPRTDVARMLIAVEVVLGIVLLLFGFREIIEYTRERARRHDR